MEQTLSGTLLVAMPKGKRVMERASAHAAEVMGSHPTTRGAFLSLSSAILPGALLSSKLHSWSEGTLAGPGSMSRNDGSAGEQKGTRRRWYFFLGNLSQKPPLDFSCFAGKNCHLPILHQAARLV